MQDTETENLDAVKEAAEETPDAPKIELRERELADSEGLNLAREPEAEAEPETNPPPKLKTIAGFALIAMGTALIFL